MLQSGRQSAAAAALLSCLWSTPAWAAGPELPPLPQLALDSFTPTVRAEIEEAYAHAARRLDDAGAAGQLGMLLHAYEQHRPAAACYERARALDPQAFEWAYLAGVVLGLAGNHEEAVAAFRDAVRLEPGYVPARLRLADTLLALGDLEAAGALYERVLAEQPQSPAAHYGLGRILAAEGRPAEAAERYRRACELFEPFGAAHYALALVYRDLGETDQAQRHVALYQRYKLDAPPSDDRVLDGVRLLRSGAREHMRRAVELGNDHRTLESIAEHEKALELDPALAQAHLNLIILYGQIQDWQGVERHYRALLDLNSSLADGHYNYGVALVNQRRLEEAAAAFRAALEVNPYYSPAHNNLGQMLEHDGRLDEAARHYREALEHDPQHRLARFNLGRMLVAFGRHAEAIDQFQKILTPEDEETPRFMYALAAAYVRAGDLEQAIQYGTEALQRAEALGQRDLAATIARDLERLQKR